MSGTPHFTQRVWTFLRERFPVWPHQILIAAQAGFGLVYLTKSAGHPVALPAILSRALSMPLLLLLIRISDELKDFEADQLHFPERPTARGLVLRGDLNRIAVFALGTVIALGELDRENVWMWIFLACTLVYIGLMRVWFFNEKKIKPSLSLALLTHNPVSIPLALFQISILGSPDTWPRQAWFYMVFSAFSALAWEVGRKIRRPADETAYVTYSQVWGPSRAAAIATLAMFGAFVSLINVGGAESLRSAVIPGLIVLGVTVGLGLRFIRQPQRYRFKQEQIEAGMLASFLYVLISIFAN